MAAEHVPGAIGVTVYVAAASPDALSFTVAMFAHVSRSVNAAIFSAAITMNRCASALRSSVTDVGVTLKACEVADDGGEIAASPRRHVVPSVNVTDCT